MDQNSKQSEHAHRTEAAWPPRDPWKHAEAKLSLPCSVDSRRVTQQSHGCKHQDHRPWKLGSFAFIQGSFAPGN